MLSHVRVMLTKVWANESFIITFSISRTVTLALTVTQYQWHQPLHMLHNNQHQWLPLHNHILMWVWLYKCICISYVIIIISTLSSVWTQYQPSLLISTFKYYAIQQQGLIWGAKNRTKFCFHCRPLSTLVISVFSLSSGHPVYKSVYKVDIHYKSDTESTKWTNWTPNL